MKKIILLMGFLALTSCEEKDVKKALIVPTTYDASEYDNNTPEELKALTSLAELSAEMKRGRIGEQVDGVKLENALTSLQGISSSYYYGLVQSDLLPELISQSGGAAFIPGSSGGVYGSYLMNKYGIENEQRIEKGFFAAAFYQEARRLTSQQLTTATSDKVIALFGAHPGFANSNNGDLHANKDRFIANYVARRDMNDGNGYYTNIQAALIKLQAAVKAGSAYKTEQDEAINDIFENWEKGSAATAINYFYSVLGKLSTTNLDEATVSSAMHSFSEILGFLEGFRTVSDKIISDAQIDEILALMNVPVGQAPTTLNVINQPANELPKLLQAMERLKAIYAFSDSEMDSFKKNWVNEQQR